MSLISIPKEILFTIGCHLAETPKALVHFGEACKQTHAIAKNTLFKELLQLCKEEAPLKKRLSALKGSNGLLEQAAEKLDKSEQIRKNIEKQFKNGRPRTQNPFIRVAQGLYAADIKEQCIEAREEYEKLKSEMGNLARFDCMGNFSGGRLYLQAKKIREEIKTIQRGVQK